MTPRNHDATFLSGLFEVTSKPHHTTKATTALASLRDVVVEHDGDFDWTAVDAS
jgi:hypothetical protein